jgi:hypothetical protein
MRSLLACPTVPSRAARSVNVIALPAFLARTPFDYADGINGFSHAVTPTNTTGQAIITEWLPR